MSPLASTIRLGTLLLPAMLLAGSPARSQEASGGWTDASPFRPLDLPTPTAIRTGAGTPGPGYWQQKVDYRIEARLRTDTHLLSGSERVRYTNRSPDPLSFLWLKLDANLCDPGSITRALDVPPLEFGDAEFDFSCVGGGAMTLDRVETPAGSQLPHEVLGTVARVDLPEPLAPGGVLEFAIDWTWTLPEYGYGRMGRDGTLYQVAQWYPRLAVYDDLSGWNIDPFLGAGEFYQEYGDFEVALTVPAGYVVTATGSLENPQEVLTAPQRERLVRARGSEAAVAIITREEALAARRQAREGTRTWRFRATNVRDFAFAMAPDFRWDASAWNGVLVQTFYRPEATLWEEANRMSRFTIRHFSERLYPYPWPHATTVEGPNEGMEYPMITFVPADTTREELFWVLTHEFGHEWYPMIVNSNERLHAWMDEGFDTFIDIASVEEYFAGDEYGEAISREPLELHAFHAAIGGQEQAMALPPDEQHDLYWTGYFKPALMLHLLQTEVLGRERFDRAFAAYTATWAFKHPTPADFFRFMEDASGMNLDWFWRGWIYSTARLDQAIEEVVHGTADQPTEIRLRSRGEMIMPAELGLEFADGTSETIRLPVEMWKSGPEFSYRLEAGRRLKAAQLDPRGVYPDDDRANDAWPR